MTTYKGAIKTIADAVTASHVNPPGSGEGSLIHVTADNYEAAAIVQNSLIEIGSKIPLNGYVYEVILGYDALGASSSLSVGDAEDPDRYVTNTVTTSAGITRLNAVNGLNYNIDETDTTNTDRQVLVSVVDTGAITGTVRCAVLWAK